MKAANENEATTEKKSPRRRYIMHETTKGGSRTKKKDNHVGSSTISTCHRHNHPAYVKGGKEKEPSALPPPYRRRRRLRCDMSFTWALSLSLLVATTNRNRSRSPQNPKVYEPRRTHEHYPVNSGRLVQVLLYCNRRARGAEDEEASELWGERQRSFIFAV